MSEGEGPKLLKPNGVFLINSCLTAHVYVCLVCLNIFLGNWIFKFDHCPGYFLKKGTKVSWKNANFQP